MPSQKCHHARSVTTGEVGNTIEASGNWLFYSKSPLSRFANKSINTTCIYLLPKSHQWQLALPMLWVRRKLGCQLPDVFLLQKDHFCSGCFLQVQPVYIAFAFLESMTEVSTAVDCQNDTMQVPSLKCGSHGLTWGIYQCLSDIYVHLLKASTSRWLLSIASVFNGSSSSAATSVVAEQDCQLLLPKSTSERGGWMWMVEDWQRKDLPDWAKQHVTITACGMVTSLLPTVENINKLFVAA